MSSFRITGLGQGTAGQTGSWVCSRNIYRQNHWDLMVHLPCGVGDKEEPRMTLKVLIEQLGGGGCYLLIRGIQGDVRRAHKQLILGILRTS